MHLDRVKVCLTKVTNTPRVCMGGEVLDTDGNKTLTLNQ